jgi:hypothetical protein
MKISPQITQIDTDYKKTRKNQCNLCNLGAFFFLVFRSKSLQSSLVSGTILGVPEIRAANE